MSVHSVLDASTIPRLGTVQYHDGKNPTRMISADRRRLEAKGVTPEELAAAFGNAITGSNRRNRRLFSSAVRAWVSRGDWDRAPDPERCPIEGCHHTEPVSSFRLESKRTGQAVVGSMLLLHLIRNHGFFGNKESDGRVDPNTLLDMLGLPRGNHASADRED